MSVVNVVGFVLAVVVLVYIAYAFWRGFELIAASGFHARTGRRR